MFISLGYFIIISWCLITSSFQPEGTLGEAMSTYGNKLQDFDSEWALDLELCSSSLFWWNFSTKMLFFRAWEDCWYNNHRSIFAHSLVEGGEALKQMADLKYALDDNVKQVSWPDLFLGIVVFPVGLLFRNSSCYLNPIYTRLNRSILTCSELSGASSSTPV